MSATSEQAFSTEIGQHTSSWPWAEELVKEIRDAYRYRYVAISYVQNNLRLRYRRSVFGFVWSVLTPLISYMVLGMVFSFTMHIQMPNFLVYFFSGSVLFNFFIVSINVAPNIMILNENYIKKIYVPKLIFILNTVAIETTNFFLGLSALLVLGVVSGKLHLSWAMLYLPVPVVLAVIFLTGVVSMLSVVAVFFRDITHVVPIFMQCILFLTPIFYPLDAVPAAFRWLVRYNPFFYFLESFRNPIAYGTMAPASYFFVMLGVSMAALLGGVMILKKFDNKIVFKL